MNNKMVINSVSKIMVLEAILLVLPLIVGIIYRENSKNLLAFLFTILIILIIFLPLAKKNPKNKSVHAREGLVSVSLSWILLSFFGGLPFFFSGQIRSLVDCFFETASGLTTTGSSIIPDLNVMTHSTLFWHSFTHFIGGMGVLVLALAIFPEISNTSIHAMKAEVPGPQFGKMLSKIKTTAQMLYLIYIGMTIALTIVLVVTGMPVFDSILHAFGTAGTGGFGVRNGSLIPYENKAAEIAITIGMLAFGVNFNLYYLILIGRAKDILKNEEFKTYIFIVLGAIFLIFINVMKSYDSISTCLKDVSFTAASLITTTGFSNCNFDDWPLFSKVILTLLMFSGACAGSTAGGLKVSRVIILFKSGMAELKRVINPDRSVVVRFEDKRLDVGTEKSVANYFIVYLFLFTIFTLIIAMDLPDFSSAFSAVAATFNNIGPGFKTVGPMESFNHLNNISKITLSFAMIMGRLELYPVLVLFSPATWRKY